MDWDDFTDMLVTGLMILSAAAALGGAVLLCVIIYDRATSPTFALIKDDWECTLTQHQRGTMLVGKVIVPTVYDVCTQYTVKD